MRTVVGVLRGGPSSDYETSLKSGAAVLEHLDKDTYEPRDIFISRAGEWHVHGVAMPPERALRGIDVAFNALHGSFGEDGQVQRLLERLGVAYTGSGPQAAAVAFHKQRTREEAAKLGLTVAHGRVLSMPDQGDISTLAREVFRSFPHPAVVKPIMGGFSRGVNPVDSYHALEHALAQAFAHAEHALIEERIPGKEASVGVIDHFRGEDPYALIPSSTAPLSHDEKAHITALAKNLHKQLGLSGYSSSDFIISKRGVYFLEIDALPLLHPHAGLGSALHAVGSKFSHFLTHVIDLATKKT